MYWPIVIALLVLGVAYALFRMLPEIIDSDNSFLHIVAVFLIIYLGTAIYLSGKLPNLNASAQNIQISQTQKNFEIIVKDGEVRK